MVRFVPKLPSAAWQKEAVGLGVEKQATLLCPGRWGNACEGALCRKTLPVPTPRVPMVPTEEELGARSLHVCSLTCLGASAGAQAGLQGSCLCLSDHYGGQGLLAWSTKSHVTSDLDSGKLHKTFPFPSRAKPKHTLALRLGRAIPSCGQ